MIDTTTTTKAFELETQQEKRIDLSALIDDGTKQ